MSLGLVLYEFVVSAIWLYILLSKDIVTGYNYYSVIIKFLGWERSYIQLCA